jgi:hypothetical protein
MTFLGTCSFALALVLLDAACNANPIQCAGPADCPCIEDCSCIDGTTQTIGCGAIFCTEACSDHGGTAGDGGG